MNTPALLPGTGPDTTILFVHAHPDDETIVTGATMAAAASAGANVVLLTCTRGELGEVIPPELAHLEVNQEELAAGEPTAEETGAGLALVREHELAEALAALGVHAHMWLGQGLTAPAGGEVVFRDSGMQWDAEGRATAAAEVLPGSFSQAPLMETADLLAAAIRDLRPDAVVTYAADGGYGHPDHVRTHQLTMAALRLATAAGPAGPAGSAAVVTGWKVPNVYAIVSDRPERPHDPCTTRIAVEGDLAAKTAAMRAHRTQITVAGQRYALSDDVWRDITAVEEFTVVDPAQIYPTPADTTPADPAPGAANS